MARKLKNVENETQTVQDLNMARNTKKLGKGEIHTLGNGVWQKTLKNMKNEKHKLKDQDYGEETEKRRD